MNAANRMAYGVVLVMLQPAGKTSHSASRDSPVSIGMVLEDTDRNYPITPESGSMSTLNVPRCRDRPCQIQAAGATAAR